jgi:hypothetical protein
MLLFVQNTIECYYCGCGYGTAGFERSHSVHAHDHRQMDTITDIRTQVTRHGQMRHWRATRDT